MVPSLLKMMGNPAIDHLANMSALELIWYGLIALILLKVVGGFIWEAIYNLYFHPLRKFPGPWLAAWHNASKDQKLLVQESKTNLSSRFVFRTGS